MNRIRKFISCIMNLLIVMVCMLSASACIWNGGNSPEVESNRAQNIYEPCIRLKQLEFWITENVDDFDFSAHQERYGIMGGRQYYGLEYTPLKNKDGGQIDPAECVIYTITSYPDYSDEAKHITHITITDPDVNIYGLTLKSTANEIKAVMDSNGFVHKAGTPSSHLSFSKENINIWFIESSIEIDTEVTNRRGIMF